MAQENSCGQRIVRGEHFDLVSSVHKNCSRCELLRLVLEIPVLERGKPWHFKHLTVKHIYYPLAKSSGKILELLRALKAQDGNRQKKLFQFLNEIGARALRMQLGRVLEMSESSKDRLTYERKIVERFGGQQELAFMATPPDEV